MGGQGIIWGPDMVIKMTLGEVIHYSSISHHFPACTSDKVILFLNLIVFKSYCFLVFLLSWSEKVFNNRSSTDHFKKNNNGHRKQTRMVAF